MALPEPEVEKVNLHASDADSEAPAGFPKPMKMKMKCEKKSTTKPSSQFKPLFKHLPCKRTDSVSSFKNNSHSKSTPLHSINNSHIVEMAMDCGVNPPLLKGC